MSDKTYPTIAELYALRAEAGLCGERLGQFFCNYVNGDVTLTSDAGVDLFYLFDKESAAVIQKFYDDMASPHTIKGFIAVNRSYPPKRGNMDDVTFYLYREDAKELTRENDDIVINATLTFNMAE